MSEHNHNHEHTHTHEHNYEHCCENHTPDNHGCGCCGDDHFKEHKKEVLSRIIISCVFFVLGYAFAEFTQLPSFVYLICYIISYVTVGFPVVTNAIEGVIHGRIFDENFLMSIASLGAFVIGEYTEGVAVMLLFTVGEFVQGSAVSRSRRAIDKIFDEKHESYTLPRHYDNKESKTEYMITRFARIYTPVICIISVLIAVVPPLFLEQEWSEWLHRGLAALVVGCPCAIVISVPLCFSAGVGVCSNDDVFVKNTGTLDEINDCDTVITYNDDMSVDDIKVLQNKGHRVIYLGKGKNDLSMFDAADVSVAVGEDCTAQSVELADMVIIRDSENAVEKVKKTAKKVHIIALENIYFSIFIKLIILVLDVVLAREIPMWFAIFGDIGVCLLAIANSARALALSKFKK